jgi:hypothetical protein
MWGYWEKSLLVVIEAWGCDNYVSCQLSYFFYGQKTCQLSFHSYLKSLESTLFGGHSIPFLFPVGHVVTLRRVSHCCSYPWLDCMLNPEIRIRGQSCIFRKGNSLVVCEQEVGQARNLTHRVLLLVGAWEVTSQGWEGWVRPLKSSVWAFD